jgi:hypothetical protein
MAFALPPQSVQFWRTYCGTTLAVDIICDDCRIPAEKAIYFLFWGTMPATKTLKKLILSSFALIR